MQNFTQIASKITTQKDNIINDVVQKSGLDEVQVKKLYENFEMVGENPVASFSSFLAPKYLDFNAFFDSLRTNEFKTEESTELTNELLLYFRKLSNNQLVSAPIIFKVVANILMHKNSVKFAPIAKESEMYEEIDTPLFESSSFIDKKESITNTVKLYEGLRDILSHNTQRWGASYHLENSYVSIMEYLKKEIELLQTENDVVSSNDDFHDQLIKQLVEGTLNPMYCQSSNLKHLIPDTQTLVFDLMLLIHTYIISHQTEMQYINIDTYNQYLSSVKKLFGCISSSMVTSRVSYRNSDQKYNEDNVVKETIGGAPAHKFILDELQLDWDKLNLGRTVLQFKSIIDMVHIIKSCSFEFNLSIRPHIRNYVTKTIELLGRSEHIILERSKINKYKNF